MGREDDRGPDRPASASFELRVPARMKELRNLRHALTGWLEGQGTPVDVGAEVALATHEAAANAVEHAYPRESGDLVVRASRDGSWLVVVIADEGRWRPPSRTDQRGRGLTLMHGLMDGVEIDPSPSGTQVTLRRHVDATR